MTDGLSVIRRVAAGTPDDSPEAALLTQSLAALDALPALAPGDDVLARVAARAAEASDLARLAAIRGAMGLGPVQDTPEGAVLAQSVAALGTLPGYPPAPSALVAVSARAEDATLAAVRATEDGETLATPEGEVLRQSVEALSSLPSYSPSDAALAAVLAHAEAASTTASRALETGAFSATVEGEVLRQSAEALESMPRYAPSDAALAAVLARAEAASVAPLLAAYGEGEALDSPEAALLVQSREALDTLPSYAPSGEAVANVLAAAAVNAPAVNAAASAPAPVASPPRPRRRAADRGAVAFGRTGVWAGIASLAVLVVAAVLFLQPPAELAPAAADIAEVVPEPPPARALAAPAEPEPEADAAGGAPPVAATPEEQILPRQATRGPSADQFAPVAERRETSAPAPSSSDRVARAEADVSPAATEWDAGDDLRLLSMRLRQLREQNEGIGWDTPSVSFGAAGPRAAGTTSGVQAVREGPPAGAIRMRPLPTDTTSRR